MHTLPPLNPCELIQLFHPDPDTFGRLAEVEAGELSEAARSLLVHDRHMTDEMQQFHHTLVDVVVLDQRSSPESYARKILLKRRSDGQVVQLGLVRLYWRWIPHSVRIAVEESRIPLGRILDEMDVLRSVQLEKLWRFQPHAETARLVGHPMQTTMFGRTARILVNQMSAIDLIEIVLQK